MIFSFNQLPEEIDVSEGFDDTNVLELSDASLDAVRSGSLKLSIKKLGSQEVISKLHIYIGTTSGKISIFAGNSGSQVFLGDKTSGVYDLRLWRESRLIVGNETTCNGARVICDHSTIDIGRGCMISDNVLIQSSDQHGIVDLKTGDIINDHSTEVVIGEHVWLGRMCVIMPDVSIGEGSIIGTGAIVSKSVPEMSIAVGSPARVVRSETTWSRSPYKMDAFAANAMLGANAE